jgi:hypothetical protein
MTSIPTRPVALPVVPEAIPELLTQQGRWVVWEYVEDHDPETGESSFDKPPRCARDLSLASTTDPRTWSTFADALDAYRRHELDGIGLVLSARPTEDLQLVGVDLDHCRDPQSGAIAPWAAEVVRQLRTYTELSPSGEGLRALLLGKLPPSGRKRGNFEVYESHRYVTVTGHKLPESPATIETRPAEILGVHAAYWPPRPTPPQNGTDNKRAQHGLSDDEILRLAAEAANGERFRRLWAGDISDYASHSEADLALCSHLAFWTGPNPDRISELFSMSGLFRNKWQREDYRQRTISAALNGRTEFYQPTARAGRLILNGNHAQDVQTTTPEPWDDPIPFGRTATMPVFPYMRLPDWLSEWASAIAEATQTPPDLAANLALAIAGAAIARKVKVTIRDGWTEPANLFDVVALPPGDRKSAVFAEALAPVVAHEQEERARLQPVIAELATEHRILEAKLKVAEAKAAKATDVAEAIGLRREAKQIAKDLAAHHVPDEPQLFCDDVTPEKLAQLLVRQGGRMLLAAPEGTAFEIAKGRYSETANFDVFLKGHSGDPLRTGRVGRGSEAIDHPALSCALTVQPDVISGLAEQASLRGRGFLARWLYAMPQSRVGQRKVAGPPVSATVRARYHERMAVLWGLPMIVVEGQDATVELEFCRQADEVLREFEAWLEPQLAEGETLASLSGWANKLAGTIARLSLILHMAARISSTWNEPIDAATVEAAVALGRDYYLPHARAAFGVMGTDRRSQDASRAVAWLRMKCESVKACQGVGIVTRSQIHRLVFGGSRSVNDVTAICQLLCDHGYLRETGNRGRRDSQMYEVHPGLVSG